MMFTTSIFGTSSKILRLVVGERGGRSLGFARDDKGESGGFPLKLLVGGRTADPSASLGMTKMGEVSSALDLLAD